ncbi:hypothetical protein FOZ61_000379 [Perkinsus olseni]|uniref:Lipoprotein n=2 Tax=Perkinsus olseni TaxID=32597 RepID=A0A7J6M062_PEROL|nr:hypothetical protein FOZ61_000379 [Perkinsus olseni]
MKFFSRQTALATGSLAALIGLQGCGSKEKKTVESAVADLASEAAAYDNFSVDNLFRGSGGRYQICSVNGTSSENPDAIESVFKLRVERMLGSGESQWKAILRGFCGASGQLEKKLGANYTSKLQGEMNCQGVWGVFHITRQSSLDAVISVCDDVLGGQDQQGTGVAANSTEPQEATAAPSGESASDEKPATARRSMLKIRCFYSATFLGISHFFKPLPPMTVSLLRQLATFFALLGIAMLQGCGSKPEASASETNTPSGNIRAAGLYHRSNSSTESYRHQKTWSVYHPGKTTHRQVCTARYNDTVTLKEYNLKLERRKEGSEKWTAKLSGRCGDRENLEADLTGDKLGKVQGEKHCVAVWEALGVTTRVIVARKHVPPVEALCQAVFGS